MYASKTENVGTYPTPGTDVSIVSEPLPLGEITEETLVEGVLKKIDIPLFKGEFSYALLVSICKQYKRSHRGDDLGSVNFSALTAAFLASLQAWDLLIDSLLRSGQGEVEFEMLGKTYKFS